MAGLGGVVQESGRCRGGQRFGGWVSAALTRPAACHVVLVGNSALSVASIGGNGAVFSQIFQELGLLCGCAGCADFGHGGVTSVGRGARCSIEVLLLLTLLEGLNGGEGRAWWCKSEMKVRLRLMALMGGSGMAGPRSARPETCHSFRLQRIAGCEPSWA